MDDTYVLKFIGEDSDMVRKIDATTSKINKQRDLTNKFNRERAKYAQQDRRDAFNSLSVEEKRLRLTRQQLDLERHLARARAQGNDFRVSALQASLARNRATTSGLAGGAGLGAAARFGVPGLGVAAIAAGLGSAVKNTFRFADEISDLADQIVVSRLQILEITKAAGYAGVSSQSVIGNLSRLEAARSAALGGDQSSKDLFSRFGVDPTKGNAIDVARAIASALGPQGMTTADRGPLGKLFGRRPEGILATLRQDASSSEDLENQLAKIDAVNARYDVLVNTLKEVKVSIFSGVTDYFDWLGTRINDFKDPLPEAKRANFGDLRRLDDTTIRPKVLASGNFESLSQRSPVSQADSLARMGLYVGGGPGSAQSIMRQQLSELKSIKEASRAIPQAIKNW